MSTRICSGWWSSAQAQSQPRSGMREGRKHGKLVDISKPKPKRHPGVHTWPCSAGIPTGMWSSEGHVWGVLGFVRRKGPLRSSVLLMLALPDCAREEPRIFLFFPFTIFPGASSPVDKACSDQLAVQPQGLSRAFPSAEL